MLAQLMAMFSMLQSALAGGGGAAPAGVPGAAPGAIPGGIPGATANPFAPTPAGQPAVGGAFRSLGPAGFATIDQSLGQVLGGIFTSLPMVKL